MELSGKTYINGIEMTPVRASSVMFVQCTMLGKSYQIDTESEPGAVRITIDNYSYDENDAKPEQQNSDPDSAVIPERNSVRKTSTCGKCNK